MRFLVRFLIVLCLVNFPRPAAQAAAQSAARIEVLDRGGAPIAALTDGDRIRLRLTLPSAASQALAVQFFLTGPGAPQVGPGAPGYLLGECSVPANQSTCETPAFQALGWYWGFTAAPPAPDSPARLLARMADGALVEAPLPEVRPRPVVLVHGFVSSAATWEQYTRAGGFLAGLGLPAYAVGDGRVPGVLNTGSLDAPLQPTNSLLQNAAVLGEYIAGVKQQTGAQMVDLLGHSMGGMISRVYLDRVMPVGERDVAQLIMLGSPALGSDCSVLPAALGWYLPASLEIRSSYARGVLNPTFTRRHGVGFFAAAGVSLADPLASPCAGVPSDGVVALDSVQAIPLSLQQAPLLHTQLQVSAEVFDAFVRPLLQKNPAGFTDQPDPAGPAQPGETLQFSRVYTGRVEPGGAQEVTIPIEAGISLASFGLFEPARGLKVTVTGASGRVIELDPQQNGELRIDDPASMLHLGYGFKSPKPGVWKVRLQAGPGALPEGADFAITAVFQGGAQLQASADPVTASAGQPVTISGSLRLNGQPLEIRSMRGRAFTPSRPDQALELQSSGGDFTGRWTPQEAGLYGLDLTVEAITADGQAVQRSQYLVVQVEPNRPWLGRFSLAAIGLGLGLACLALLAGMAAGWLLLRRRSARG
ncbi:MAG: esterase/lipase family protein [Chloroflexota bacterium]